MELIKIALLRQILLAQNPAAVTDPQTLLSQAQCYVCFANSSTYLALLELALLAQISNNGSTGGGGSGTNQITSGTVNPVAPPANPAIANAYFNSTTGVVFFWPAGGSAWQ